MTENHETDYQAAVRWLAMLRADVAQTVNGVFQRGARPVHVGTGHHARALSSPGVLAGFMLSNDSDAARAVIAFRDGDADNIELFRVTLAAGESARDWYGPGGINLSRGLHVSVVSGAVSGVVLLGGVE